jgi:membrane-bound ClpP family serine protease
MAAGAFLLVLVPLEAAHAALGENAGSLARDHEALRGMLIVTPMQGYDVHTMVGASGVTVREYAAHTGNVFAVTWSGTQVPDLKRLLGTYFERYVSLAQTRRTGHHVLSINTPGLVMTSIRIQRMATGQAYVPGLLPSGVSPRELR